MYSGVYDKKGTLIRCIYLFISISIYILTLGGRFFKKNSVVLCYHGILSTQQERFAWQIEAINNYKFKNVLITFDDAFENLIKNSLPILKKFHVSAIIFAVPGNLGKTPQWDIATDHPEYKEKLMAVEQLAALSQEHLFRIGSHTLTHPDLAKITQEKVKQELVQSRRSLEMLLNYPIEDLALPHGSYNNAVLEMAKEAGYKRIYTLQPKRVSERTLSEGTIGRFSMSPNVWKIEFLLTCAGAYSWLANFRLFLHYITTWALRGKRYNDKDPRGHN